MRAALKALFFWAAVWGLVDFARTAVEQGAPLVDDYLPHVAIALPVAIATVAIAITTYRELEHERARELALNLVVLSSFVPGVLVSVLILDFRGWDEIWNFALDLGPGPGNDVLDFVAVVLIVGLGLAFTASLGLPVIIARWWFGAHDGPVRAKACANCGRVPRDPERRFCSRCRQPLGAARAP